MCPGSSIRGASGYASRVNRWAKRNADLIAAALDWPMPLTSCSSSNDAFAKLVTALLRA